MRIASALVALSLLALAPAAEARPGLPDGAVPVAGPTASGARLFVWDEGGPLCGTIARKPGRYRRSSCGAAPEALREPMISFYPATPVDRVWGFVSPEVATVEIVFAHGRRVAAATTPGSRYHGKHAGKLRFFLLETRLRRGDGPLYARLLDANGALLAAADATEGDGRQEGTVEVARGRVGRAPWSLRAFTTRGLSSLPGDEERVTTRRCVGVSVPNRFSARFPQLSSYACDDPDFPGRDTNDVSRTCGPIGIRVVGLVAPGSRLQAVLGDGRRVRLRLHALPRRFGALRAFALTLPPQVALRELASIEDGRRHVEVGGLAPGVIDCPNSSSGFLSGFDFALPRFGPGPPALQLRDNGVLLCATLGLPDPKERDCGRPPIDERSSWILSRPTADSTTVAGVVPPTVGSVEVVLSNGERHVVATATDSPYMGRYSGLVRVFSITVPGSRQARRVTLIALDGHRLTTIPLFSPPVFDRAPQTVLRARGGWTLGAGIVRVGPAGSGVRRLTCLQLVRGGKFSANPYACSFVDSTPIRVTCHPKGMLLYGRLPLRAQGLEVHTTDGTVEAKTASLRAAGAKGRGFVAEVPGHAGLRSIVVRGAKTERHRLRLPPADRQCGYSDDAGYR